MQTNSVEPIRIFIGSSLKNSVEEAVMRYTLQKYSRSALEIHVMDGITGVAKNLSTGETKSLPAGMAERIPNATAFSLARWAIPEWCNHQGRALYFDSDQLAIADVAELWNYDLAGAMLAAVQIKQVKCHQYYIDHFLDPLIQANEIFHLTSVMVMDCQKTPWNISQLVDLMDQNAFSFTNLMNLGEQFRQYFNCQVALMPREWNHLNCIDRDSKLVHFTDLTDQPWRFDHNDISDLWERFYLEAIDAGMIPQSTLDTAFERKGILPRIKALGEMPKLIRRPINWVWRTWDGTTFELKRWLDIQQERLKFRLKNWTSIRA
jgi:Glycosyl transferase family 8